MNAAPSNPRVSYTLFSGLSPSTADEKTDVLWSDFVARVESPPTFANKAACPLVSLAEYGDSLSAAGCVRHAENVLRIYGVEFDYDGGVLKPARAAAILQSVGIEAVLHSTPSSTLTRPRWRALLPLSEPEVPGKRAEFVGRVNAVLAGAASRESFTLSQSFYIGKIAGAPYESHVTHGRCIDEATEIAPRYYNADAPGDRISDDQLREAFARGDNRYQSMLSLSSRWAARGMRPDDIEAALLALIGDSPMNADNIDLRTRCRPMAQSAWKKYGDDRAKAGPEPAVEENPFSAGPMADDWLLVQPPEQEFLIDQIVPAGGVTLFAAQSGTGKSTLALGCAIGVATGHGWLGLHSLPGAVAIYLALEDGDDVVRRRVYWIAQRRRNHICRLFGEAAGVAFDAALRSRLFVKSLLGHDVQLIFADRGVVEQSRQVGELREALIAMAAGRPALLILDPLLNLHSGDANAENVGKTLIRAVAGVTQAAPHFAALLPCHTSKFSIREREMSALAVRGSMSLVDSSRSVVVAGRVEGAEELRKLFDPATLPDDDLPTANVVKLMHVKSNYGQAAEPLFAVYRSGTFEPLKATGSGLHVQVRRLGQWVAWFKSTDGKPRSRKQLTEVLREDIWPRTSKRCIGEFLARAVIDGDAVIVRGEVKAGQDGELLLPREAHK